MYTEWNAVCVCCQLCDVYMGDRANELVIE